MFWFDQAPDGLEPETAQWSPRTCHLTRTPGKLSYEDQKQKIRKDCVQVIQSFQKFDQISITLILGK